MSTDTMQTADETSRSRAYGILRAAIGDLDHQRAHAAMRWLFGRGTPGEALGARDLVRRAFPERKLDRLFAEATEASVAARDYSYTDAPMLPVGGRMLTIHLPELEDLEREPAFGRIRLRTQGVAGHQLAGWGARKIAPNTYDIDWTALDWTQREMWWGREDPLAWLARQGGVASVEDAEAEPESIEREAWTGQRARQAIEAAGLTPEQVAAELELARTTVARWFGRDALSRRDQYALERAIAELLARGEND